MKHILVTGIGGNVGQGILRNIAALPYRLYIVGTNTELVSGGNHLCDRVYKVPFSSETDYIPKMRLLCNREHIDLIIPSTDYESYYLSLNQQKLPVIATSPSQTNKIFLDKYMTAQEFIKHHIPFAQTYLPSQYHNTLRHYIVKPREGRGSRDIFLNPKNLNTYTDAFIVQKLYTGKEITTGFYVTKQNMIPGSITFIRELTAGTTTKCQVTHRYDTRLNIIMKQMIKHFTIRGSCNIQSVVTSTGAVIPFEVNGRISGTNSIRSQFGFEDVKYTIEEYLFDKNPAKPKIKNGSAVRILTDIIYPGTQLRNIQNKKTPHYLF